MIAEYLLNDLRKLIQIKMFKDNEVECMVLFLVNKNVKVRDSKYRGIWVLSFNGE